MPSPVDITARQISDTGKQRSFSPGIREIKWSTNYQNGPSRFSTWDGVKRSHLAQPTVPRRPPRPKRYTLPSNRVVGRSLLRILNRNRKSTPKSPQRLGSFWNKSLQLQADAQRQFRVTAELFERSSPTFSRSMRDNRNSTTARVAGGEKWLARIHAVKWKDLTPNKIQKWKVAFVARAGTDPTKRRVAQISVNSLIATGEMPVLSCYFEIRSD